MRYFPPRRTNVANATGWNGQRDRTAQQHFRNAVLFRDGGACIHCGATTDLRACHLVPLSMGGTYDVSNGATRCKGCDKATDGSAR